MPDIVVLHEIEKRLKINFSDPTDDIIEDRSYTIDEAGNVTGLNLSESKIEKLDNIVPTLLKLKKLRVLLLNDNFIKDISLLRRLPQLRELELSRNLVSDITPLLALNQLERLFLDDLKCKNFAPLSELKRLVNLSIENNAINNLEFLEPLTELEAVWLGENHIKDISPIKALKNLRAIDLRHNEIKDLPIWITELGLAIKLDDDISWQAINLFNNPLETPPLEIIARGKTAINRFFDKVAKEGLDYIYEAKLTLVGEGNAGKTSLQVRLLNSREPLPRKDKRTRGIKIFDWNFKGDRNKQHIAHIWDFGGQDVYYPVHRFFLTENSVFVLLASTRQTNHNFDYWIPTIYQFGGKSPIILGQTCHDGNRVVWNDIGYYISNPQFNIIKTDILPYYELNLPKRNEGLNRIKQVIIDQIVNLPHYGKGVPKSYILVRNALIKHPKKNSCISFEDFVAICKNSSAEFENLIDVEDCAKFLHAIGAVLWYFTNDELKNWVVLQPEWAMNAVYKIIDDGEIQSRRGTILPSDFPRLWKEQYYTDRHYILKKMLQVFKIAFPKKHKSEEYIIPARLLSMPSDIRWAHDEPHLRLEYVYDFMPKGMVNQLSAELSRYIMGDQVWNNAVNIESQNKFGKCQIEEDFYTRRITIKAKGKDARGLIMIVMDTLNNITDGYKGVHPQLIVPCTCKKCKTSSTATKFAYQDLLRWALDEENSTVVCNEGRTSLSIDELLYNVGLASSPKSIQKNKLTKVVKIFLASSSELLEDRRDFEIFINRQNKLLKNSSIFLELEIWEDFIDSMSPTRLQDEYNKVITESDVFISLFFSKVGKYTAEEFDTAFGQFKKTGKPLVYTYFKDGTKNLTQIRKEDINSKFAFEEKLKSLGHYATVYKNIDDLKYQFKMQLDKILPTL